VGFYATVFPGSDGLCVFFGKTIRSMKSPWAIISATRQYTFILSISIHALIFSIPISMVIKPHIHDMELFVSIEDIRNPHELVKSRMEAKKPQPEPVKEIIKPTEVPCPKIQNPEIIEPVREVRIEPVKEVKKEPAEETKEQSLKVESKSMSQPATESREAFFVPTVSNIPEGNTGVLIKDGAVGTASGVGKQPLVSHNVTGGDTGHPIETRFGASIAPAFLHREMPSYPMFARKLGREGRVMLKLTIDENGNLLDVEVIEKAGYGFTEAAVEAVKKSTFLPAKKDGKPIASRTLLPIRFQLERN
jgi:TonB family protein